MAVGQPGLGALRRSRRALVKTMRANATEESCRTQKAAPRSMKPAKQSLWELAGVEARAFATRDGQSVMRQFPMRVTMLLALAVYERRTHPSGRAVCLLRLRRRRLWVGLSCLALLICVAGALSPYAGATLALVLIAVSLPASVGALRRFPERRQLEQLTSSEKQVYVHSLASTLPGAGADLLRTLTREADEKVWPLVLDANNERLTRYYSEFGFVAAGSATRRPDGNCPVRMRRRPSALEGGRHDDK
jgi:hypothetical protein